MQRAGSATAETADRIAGRKAAEPIIARVEAECVGKSLVFVKRIWGVIQDRSVDMVGLPIRAAVGVEPMNDKQAGAFRETEIPWGKHAGETIETIENRDPEYLAFLADGNQFTKDLRRYLARTKFATDDP